ncbi:MAG: tetratricopeptide repeat protein, partial [Bacteroidales bacterium]|nr:tetratricopeptide repeat protein [Bacteroidales bacterium]
DYFLKAGRLRVGDAMSYLRAKYCYEQLNDNDKVEAILKEGFEAYPHVTDMINTLINYYIQAQKNDEALVYLNSAIEKDPANAQYFFARGCLKEKSNVKEAIADYQKSIELNPQLYGATYNIGVVYYNEALNKKTEASGIRDNNAYNAMINESNEILKKAVPYFIKAAELAPDKTQKREVLANLQRTYYTLQEYTKSQEVKAQIDELDAAQ